MGQGKGEGMVRNVNSIKKDRFGLIPRSLLNLIDSGALKLVGAGAQALIAKSRRGHRTGRQMFGNR